MKQRTVVMMRAHRRASLLNKTLRFYEALDTSAHPIEICLMLDRPTRRVKEVADLHAERIARTLRCPFPILSFDGGDRFMDAANYQLENGVEPLEPHWVIFSDDDRWPEASYAREHAEAVDQDHTDCWYIRSLFFWNEDHIRTDFFDHNSIFIWRHTPGDRFDSSYNQCPQALHRRAHEAGRTRQLESRLLDFGYSSPEERRQCFKAHTDTGRLDAVTLHLLDQQVQLEKYSG